jgi:hypothetical protein
MRLTIVSTVSAIMAFMFGICTGVAVWRLWDSWNDWRVSPSTKGALIGIIILTFALSMLQFWWVAYEHEHLPFWAPQEVGTALTVYRFVAMFALIVVVRSWTYELMGERSWVTIFIFSLAGGLVLDYAM